MIAIIKKMDNEKYWQRYTYIGTLKDCGGSVKMMLPLWKRVWQIPKKSVAGAGSIAWNPKCSSA